jgi:hypothetical protein
MNWNEWQAVGIDDATGLPLMGRRGTSVGASAALPHVLTDDIKHMDARAQFLDVRKAEHETVAYLKHLEDEITSLRTMMQRQDHDHHQRLQRVHETVQRHPHARRGMDILVPVDSVSPVTPGTPTSITSIPVVRTHIRQLVIASTTAPFVGISQIQVGMKILVGGSNFATAAVFSELAILTLNVDLGIVDAGTPILTNVLFTGTTATRILGTFMGDNLTECQGGAPNQELEELRAFYNEHKHDAHAPLRHGRPPFVGQGGHPTQQRASW